jgi:uncharacterized membrane protein
MPERRLEDADVLVGPLYGVALLLVATPMFDFLTSVFPIRAGNIEWRFATVGLLSGFLLTPLLGYVLAMLAAQIGGHRIVQRVLAICALIMTALLALMLVAFVLDVLQLRSVVQAEAATAFKGASIKALVKHVSVLVVLPWLAIRGMKLSKRDAAAAPKKRGAAIIVGS